MQNETFIILVGCAGLLLVDDLGGHGHINLVQYIALAVVGAVLLFVGTFAPSLATAFAALFGISILLNSPNGIPIISNKSSTANTTSVITSPTKSKGTLV